MGWIYLLAFVCTAAAAPARANHTPDQKGNHNSHALFAATGHAGEIELVNGISVSPVAHHSTVKKFGSGEISALAGLPDRPDFHGETCISAAERFASLHLALLFPSHYFW